MASRRSGFTLVELIVVMAVIAIAGAIASGIARPSNELRAAGAVKSMLVFARLQALWQGTVVAVTPLPLGGGFTVSRGPFDTSGSCQGGRVLSRLLLSEYPGVRLSSGFSGGGLAWLPSGSGRSCAGGGVISSTLTLTGLRGAANVIVSSLGRVRVERAP